MAGSVFDTGTGGIPFMDSQGGASAEGSAVGGAVGLGLGLATGNPIAIIGGIASLVGAGMSFLGSSGEAKVQSQEAQVSAEIAGQEEQINTQRQILAQQIYQRQSLENFRRTNVAYHTARAAAVNQGVSAIRGQSGSGLPGGESQVEAEGAVNQTNLSDNFLIGQRIFGLTSSIDQYKQQLARLGGSAASYAGEASLGSSIASAGPALTRLSAGFGLPNPGIGFQGA